VSDAERHFIISRLFLALTLGSVVLLVRDYLKHRNKMETEDIVSEIDRYFRASRIQSLVNPLQQQVIEQITNTWKNESYTSQNTVIDGLRR